MDQFVISPHICLGDFPATLTSFIVLRILDYRPLSNFNQKWHQQPPSYSDSTALYSSSPPQYCPSDSSATSIIHCIMVVSIIRGLHPIQQHIPHLIVHFAMLIWGNNT
jgi:hypothetical protein